MGEQIGKEISEMLGRGIDPVTGKEIHKPSNAVTMQTLQDELNDLIGSFPANCHERYKEELRALLAAAAVQISQLRRTAVLTGSYGAPSVAALPKRKRMVGRSC